MLWYPNLTFVGKNRSKQCFSWMSTVSKTRGQGQGRGLPFFFKNIVLQLGLGLG